MKKVASMMLALFLLMLSTSSVFAMPQKFSIYSDVSNDFWAFEPIFYLQSSGVVKGYDDGSFRPNALLKRAHVAKMLYRWESYSYGHDYYDDEEINIQFDDVEVGSEEHEAFSYLYDRAFHALADGKKMYPYRDITRGETAIILAKLFNLSLTGQQNDIKDVPKNSKFYPYVNALVNAKATKLYEGNYFKPDATLTRAQFAAFLARIVNPYFVTDRPERFSDTEFFFNKFSYQNGERVLNVYGYDPYTGQEKVATYDNGNYPIAKNGALYYTQDLSSNLDYIGTLIMKVDRHGTQIVSNESIEWFTIIGDKIYFASLGKVLSGSESTFYETMKLKSMNLDGTNVETLRDWPDSAQYSNGFIYYTDEDGTLKRFHLETRTEEVVLTEHIDYFRVCDGGIVTYVWREGDEEGADSYFIPYDGSTQVKLHDDFYKYEPIMVKGDKIYYYDLDAIYNGGENVGFFELSLSNLKTKSLGSFSDDTLELIGKDDQYIYLFGEKIGYQKVAY